MSRRVYNPDHTAHIRQKIRTAALHGAVGLIIGFFAAALLVLLEGRSDGAWSGAFRIVWIILAVLIAFSVLHLALAGVGWAWYRHRRAELDATGAEAVGESNARLANLRRDER